MRRWLIILTGLVLALNASSAYSLTIIQPVNNSVVYPGQKIKVVIEAASNEDIAAIVVSATPTGSSSEVLIAPPYEIELRIGDQYVGNARVEAIARLTDDTAVKTGIDISVQLPPDVKLEKIITDKNLVIRKKSVTESNNTKSIFVRGLFSDGIKRELDVIGGAQYTSSDTNIVTVDNKGVVTALKLGTAMIVMSAGGKTENIDVEVYLNIELDRELLVKPTDTGIQLDWKLSPQDPEWVTSYMVFRTEDPDGIVKKKIADVPNGTTTYVDTSAAHGKTYYYGVQAMSATANERSSMTNMTSGILP
ncbi:MAG: hypothetical protein HY888_13735 [Deltaproteobacteria bacterium]|nr:hypothetical protein [Deltaproteobacteria bacterium]